MAYPLAFRLAVVIAIKVGPPAWRLVQGPGLENVVKVNDWIRRNLGNPDVTDAELQEEFNRLNEYPVVVATITGDFETRRFQLIFTVQGAALLDEDVRVVTFHNIKLSGGQPVSTWDPADFTTLHTAFMTWWNAIKLYYHTNIHLAFIKAYKAGPNIVPPQPPVYEGNPDVPGSASANAMPPQVALSVTERAGQKKNWGRFYLPAPSISNQTGTSSLTQAGRPSTEFMTAVADATDSLYETALTANLPFCVYRPTLEANRPVGNPPAPSELPERPANAQTVDTIQVDDVFDVIRRRRWENPTLRLQRGVGSAAAMSQDLAGVTDESNEDQLGVQTP